MKKSQYSMEFLIFFAMLSILFFIWLVIYVDLNQEVFMERDKKAIMDLGKSIQTQIFLASNMRSGYHSNNLILPEKAGFVNFEINNSQYVFYFITDKGDFIFNIPYTIGNLEKGRNILWNVKGVVAIGAYPPIVTELGEVEFTRCSNNINDDGDPFGLIDKQDGSCWSNYNSPSFDYTKDELIAPHIPPQSPEEVYKYYVLCKNAQENALCSILDLFHPDFSQNTCCQYTSKHFCAVNYDSCSGGDCVCPSLP